MLINLRDAAEQATALGNIARWLKPGGKLILAEGFTDGFEALNGLRRTVRPAGPGARRDQFLFAACRVRIRSSSGRSPIADEFHTGMFDFLTRIGLSAAGGARSGRRIGRFPPQDRPRRAPVQSDRACSRLPGCAASRLMKRGS